MGHVLVALELGHVGGGDQTLVPGDRSPGEVLRQPERSLDGFPDPLWDKVVLGLVEDGADVTKVPLQGLADAALLGVELLQVGDLLN